MNMNTENTHTQNLEANQLTAKLIETAADDFDLSISQCIHSLVNQVSTHRGIDMEAAHKILINLLEVKENKCFPNLD